MNKKFLCGILCGALLIASASAFVSCKDYDDDITSLQKQVDQKTGVTDYTTLSQAVTANKAAADAALATITSDLKKAEEAANSADASLQAAITAEANARVAADAAAATAAKDYTDAQVQAAAQAAADQAQKVADEAAAQLKAAQELAAQTYATKAELQAAKDALQAAVTAAQNDATSALAKCEELKTAIANAEASLTAAYEKADEALKADLEKQIAQLKVDLASETGKLVDADAALEKKITEANALITKANENIAAIQADVAVLQAKVKTLEETTIPAIQEDIKAVKSDLDALKSTHADDVKTLTAAIAANEKSIAVLKTSLAATNEALESLKTRVASIEASITTVKNDLAAHVVVFNAFKASVENSFVEVWDSVAGLDARCKDIEAQAAKIEETYNKRCAAIEDAVSKLADLEAGDVEALKASLTLEKENILATVNTELTAAKIALTTAYTEADNKIKEELAAVKTQLAQDIKDAITTCKGYTDDEIAALKKYVESGDLTQKGYTNAQIHLLDSALSKAIETSEAAAKAYAKDYADEGDEALEEMCNTLLKKITAEATARQLADEALKDYVDSLSSAYKTALEASITALSDSVQKLYNANKTYIEQVKAELAKAGFTADSLLSVDIDDLDEKVEDYYTKTTNYCDSLSQVITNNYTTLADSIFHSYQKSNQVLQAALNDLTGEDGAIALGDEEVKEALADSTSALSQLIEALTTKHNALDAQINGENGLADKYASSDLDLQKYADDAVAQLRAELFGEEEASVSSLLNTATKKLGGLFGNVQDQIDAMITSIVYQGDGTQGTYTATPTDYSNQPRIYWANVNKSVADGAYIDVHYVKAWPNTSATGYLPEMYFQGCPGKAGKYSSSYIVEEKGGYLYASINPTSTDFTGTAVDLENSQGEANKFFKLENTTQSSLLITRGASNGLYALEFNPIPSTVDKQTGAYSGGFRDDLIENDNVLYAMAANWTTTDVNKQQVDHKVTSSYGLNSSDKGFYNYLKPAIDPVADWHGVQITPAVTPCPSNVPFNSQYEFTSTDYDVMPAGQIKLDLTDLEQNYKWYVDFYVDGKLLTKATLEQIFDGYKDEVRDCKVGSVDLKLKDTKYLNVLFTVKVRALGYNYHEAIVTHTISFTKPLLPNKAITATVTPGDDNDSNDNQNSKKTAGILHTTCYFTESMQGQFSAEEMQVYANTTAPSWVATNVWPYSATFTTPYAVVYNTSTKKFYLSTKYDPYYVYLGANNSFTLTCKDTYGHAVVVVDATMTVNKPNHLDSNISSARQLPAAFNFFTKVDDATEAAKAKAALGENYIIAWTYTDGVADYRLNGAFKDLDASGDYQYGYIPDVSSTPGKGTADSPWTMSWLSRYAFKTADSGIRFYNYDSKYVVKNLDNTFNSFDTQDQYSVKLEKLTDITVFGNVVNSGTYTHNGGKKGAFNYAGFKQFSGSLCVDYYGMNEGYHNLGADPAVRDHTFFSDATQDFKITFVDPINYGFSEKNNPEVAFECPILPAPGLNYNFTSSAAKDIYFWIDHSTTANNKFYLNDSRIINVEIYYDKTNENAQFIKNWSTSGTYFRFDYTSESYNQPITIDAWMVVTDVWGVQSKIDFTIKLVKTGVL